jgi:tetratricopeptide (TPR) repeat protein
MKALTIRMLAERSIASSSCVNIRSALQSSKLTKPQKRSSMYTGTARIDKAPEDDEGDGDRGGIGLKPEIIVPYDPNDYKVNLYFVNIDVSDTTRFLPSIKYYSHPDLVQPKPSPNFDIILQYMVDSMYSEAETELKNIIENFPATIEAENAWSFLPYVVYKMDGDFDELLNYINEDEDETMYFKKIETIARIRMMQKDFLEAIALFEMIINELSIEVNARLLAELDQAYCYVEMAETNITRATLPRATRMPKKYSEYIDIRDEIINRINQSILSQSEPEVTIPEVIEFSVSNYPNPFNPTTTIKFGINSSHVTIDIFNVKGQKIRSLVDSVYPAGEHSVVWNGNDDSGRSVGSGIYFYRINAGEYNATKKMLLIK